MKTTKILGLVFLIVLSASLFSALAFAAKGGLVDSSDLVRTDFIHYKTPNGNAATVAFVRGGGSGNPARATTCYSLLGPKWTALPVTYAINPLNPQNLSYSFVEGAISAGAETWDAMTSKELFNNVFLVDPTAQYGFYDGENAIVFGNYGSSSVIAVTSVWSSRRNKQIVEFDMEFNTQFKWGDATYNSSVMDLQNIATHELGHSVGLGDIYSGSCTSVTMYGYSGYGETSKRTLEQPDVSGLQKLYGI